MKSFKEFILEGLTYTVEPKKIEKFKNINSYNVETNGDVTTYSKDGEIVFVYNKRKKQLTVIKRAWQLMNLERGY